MSLSICLLISWMADFSFEINETSFAYNLSNNLFDPKVKSFIDFQMLCYSNKTINIKNKYATEAVV